MEKGTVSIEDQKHLEHIVGMLPKSGKWRWVTLVLAIPAFVGAISALATYSIATVSFLSGVNYAVRIAPIHDTAIQRIDRSVQSAVSSENELRDTLNSEGYHFTKIR